ncbi:MAG: hypothetical protein JRI66_10690 [Deltaproteobacteria bacterium]|nr:hypothetical protein [Deltaproteobacteria bacterium]
MKYLEYLKEATPVIYEVSLIEIKGRFSTDELALIVDAFQYAEISPKHAGINLWQVVEDEMAEKSLDQKWDVSASLLSYKIRHLLTFAQKAALETFALQFWEEVGFPGRIREWVRRYAGAAWPRPQKRKR